MLGTALIAAASLAGAAGAAPARKDDQNKIICRDLAETGSRLATKRVCLTRQQWREQKDAERNDLDKAQRIRTGPDGT